VIEVAENQEQKKNDKLADAARKEQLDKAIETNRQVSEVLSTSQVVADRGRHHVEKNSLGCWRRIAEPTQVGTRFTPLGSHVMVDLRA